MAKILLEPFQNVVATGQAQLTTQRIWPNTLEYISLILGGTTFTKNQITNLQVRLGQKTIWYIGSGTDMQAINSYEGRATSATLLTLPFANPFARTPKQQYLGAIDFGSIGVRDLTILVTITGATAPTLVAYAEVAPPKTLDAASNLLFRAILQTPIASAASTTFQPFLINYGQSGGALLRRLVFATALANIVALEIKRDGLDIFEQITFANYNNMTLELFPHAQQVGYEIYDAIEDDIESKALTSVRADSQGNISLIPQQINVSLNGAQSLNVYADVFANLNGL
jgi:Viral coat protein P2 N-terminal domain